MPHVSEPVLDAILDASAVLTLLWNEPGSEQVEAVIERAAISAVNWSEVATVLSDRGMSGESAAATLQALPIASVIPFDRKQAELAGSLRRATKSVGLSLGNRACLALALAQRLPAITADRAWTTLDRGADVRLIR